MSLKANLSAKDEKFRNFALNDNMWKVVLYVGTPLALYQSLNQLFKIFDSMMAAHISASSVSAVAYLSQINLMLSALGGGLAIGSSLKISEAYGAGDYELVKKRVSSLFAMCGILGTAILLLLIPAAPQFLRFARTPESFIAEGTQYFRLELIGMVISFFNNVYIAIERARGNSRRILHLNMGVIAIKLSLTALFVYVLGAGINMISAATIVSQSFLLAAAVVNLNQKDNAFGFSFHSISLKPAVTKPMIFLSIPVIIEKIAFSFGKVIINSMSTIYSALTVGALGISNNIGGITTMPQNGFQEGGSAIISQSVGAGKPKRALKAFGCILLINIILGATLMSFSLFFLDQVSALFAGNDGEFGRMIASIYRYEAYGAIPLGINAAVLALLYGFGRTKITLTINFCRVFVFRVPVLWYLQNFTDLGSTSVGIVMAVSNIATGIFALIIGLVEIHRICRQYDITFSFMQKYLETVQHS
ncbi:MATE family efflux transporter [Clostridium sp. Marseille-P2415]|uniref:MATE family efflux transporter n=1 Tax=Clostridium sp. Marseille-P2415 TaxID=1805471 RepID=UPI0009885EA3|nr:MATE family efflux transporter [Clostridium sp. Marseille-P2415]